MAGGDMSRNPDHIPHSALYTAATWRWGNLSCAEFVAPKQSEQLFNVVNAYMKFYRFINPKKYSLHHTLLHRHTMINYLLDRAGCQQIIEVAAGFSPRGSHYSRNPDVTYYEVDLPDVVLMKRRQFESTAEGRGVLQRENFIQKSGDVRTLDFLQDFPAQKSFVISEGLMMYFSRQEQLAIWKNIASLIRERGGEYVFDYIPLDIEPGRSLVGRVLHGIKNLLGGDGQGYCYDNRSRWDVRDDLLAAGFSQVDVLESDTKVADWHLPYSEVKTHVVIYHCR